MAKLAVVIADLRNRQLGESDGLDHHGSHRCGTRLVCRYHASWQFRVPGNRGNSRVCSKVTVKVLRMGAWT